MLGSKRRHEDPVDREHVHQLITAAEDRITAANERAAQTGERIDELKARRRSLEQRLRDEPINAGRHGRAAPDLGPLKDRIRETEEEIVEVGNLLLGQQLAVQDAKGELEKLRFRYWPVLAAELDEEAREIVAEEERMRQEQAAHATRVERYRRRWQETNRPVPSYERTTFGLSDVIGSEPEDRLAHLSPTRRPDRPDAGWGQYERQADWPEWTVAYWEEARRQFERDQLRPPPQQLVSTAFVDNGTKDTQTIYFGSA